MEFFYRCSECDSQYAISPNLMLCPDCSSKKQPGEPLRGVLEVGFTGSPYGWPGGDYGDLLPVARSYFPPIPVGQTPLWEPSRLREKTGFPWLYLKDDSANPTSSLKDRASALVAAFARKNGIHDVVVASTGNAASSMAGIGAAAGLNIKIFVPQKAPRAKLIQSLQYGADVSIVDGTYDDAFAESLSYTAKHGGLSRNTGYNPLTIEGKKTVALEIFEQLGRMPDRVYVPTGDGVILGGVFKGFEDIVEIGLAAAVPTIVAVQAETSNAIFHAWRNHGAFPASIDAATVADSISVAIPANGHLAVKKLHKHKGSCVLVSDEEILEAQRVLSSASGLFAEPAAAAAYAGFMKESQSLATNQVIVLLITGSGLKDIDAASRSVRIPS